MNPCPKCGGAMMPLFMPGSLVCRQECDLKKDSKPLRIPDLYALPEGTRLRVKRASARVERDIITHFGLQTGATLTLRGARKGVAFVQVDGFPKGAVGNSDWGFEALP